MDIDKFQAMLAEMLDELPEPFFEELHGGVIVSPRCKENPHSRGGDLYILGEYHRSHAMGNQIVIYYGSFMRLYGKAAEQTFERELRAVLGTNSAIIWKTVRASAGWKSKMKGSCANTWKCALAAYTFAIKMGSLRVFAGNREKAGHALPTISLLLRPYFARVILNFGRNQLTEWHF